MVETEGGKETAPHNEAEVVWSARGKSQLEERAWKSGKTKKPDFVSRDSEISSLKLFFKQFEFLIIAPK